MNENLENWKCWKSESRSCSNCPNGCIGRAAALREELRGEFSALRTGLVTKSAQVMKTRLALGRKFVRATETRRVLRDEIRVGDEETRSVLRDEIRAGDEETRSVCRRRFAGDEETRRVLR